MAITVGPTERCTHHVALKDSDGYQIGIIAAAVRGGVIEKDVKHLNRSPIDRTAMKTSSGDTEYSDWRPPYYALKQDDFSGGRALDDFSKDKTRFLDAGGLNTRRGGYVHLNGQEQLSALLRSGGQLQPGNMAEPSVPTPNSTEWATKITPDTFEYNAGTQDQNTAGASGANNIILLKITAGYTGVVTEFRFRADAGVAGNVVFGLYADSAGSPGALLGQTATLAVASGTREREIKVPLTTAISITSGTAYWIGYNSSGDIVGAIASAATARKYKAAAFAALPNPAGTGYSDATTVTDIISIWGLRPIDQIWIWSHLDTAISGVKLYDGADAAFVTLLQTTPNSTPPSFAPGWHVIDLTSAVTVDLDGIWISVPLVAGTTKYAPDGAIAGYLKQAGSPVLDEGFPCRAVVKKEPSYGKLFNYWYRPYYLQTIDGVTHLWKNGYAGMLTTGGTATAIDDTFAGVWETNELAGKIFFVRGGSGFSQHQRWRVIASNTSAGAITFSDGFDVALDATTFYCILGTDHWEEIPGGVVGTPALNQHGLTGYVHDILVANNGVVYFAQGSAFAMVKMYEGSVAADAGSLYFADDAAAPGPRFICQVGNTLWGVEHTEATQARSAATGNITDGIANARVWSSSIQCGSIVDVFSGLVSYIDSFGYKAPMIFKEGEFGFISQGEYNRVQLDEMQVLASSRNGRFSLAHDTNVYFSFANGLQRWYNPNLDSVGPNQDEGLPETRAGAIRCGAGYPGRFFIGVDGDTTGYSSVLSSGGWHEEWRGAYGQRVLSIMPQTIPGVSLDRLWIAAGGDLLWVPMPSDTPNPLNDSNMLYTAGGYLETSSYYTELKTALKYIASIKFIFKDILTEQYSEIQYSLDEGTTWTDLDNAANPTTDDDTTILYNLTNVVSGTPYYGLNGYSLRLRIKLFTTDKTKTPVLKALVVEGLARIVNKYSYTVPFVLEGSANKHPLDLLNQEEVDSNSVLTTADGKLATLIDWADEGPLFMESMDARFDNKMVLLLPFVETLVKRDDQSGEVQYIGQLTLQDA